MGIRSCRRCICVLCYMFGCWLCVVRIGPLGRGMHLRFGSICRVRRSWYCVNYLYVVCSLIGLVWFHDITALITSLLLGPRVLQDGDIHST